MVHVHLRLNTYFCGKECNWEFLGLVYNYQLLEKYLCNILVPNVTTKHAHRGRGSKQSLALIGVQHRAWIYSLRLDIKTEVGSSMPRYTFVFKWQKSRTPPRVPFCAACPFCVSCLGSHAFLRDTLNMRHTCVVHKQVFSSVKWKQESKFWEITRSTLCYLVSFNSKSREAFKLNRTELTSSAFGA
jgi:hypothetical protein